MSEIELDYDISELSDLEYAKVTYTGRDGAPYEVITEVKILGAQMIFLAFREEEPFDIQYPQQIIVKFVTDNGLYIAMTSLQSVKKAENHVYLTMPAPETMIKRQKRRYYRIKLDRACVLIANQPDGQCVPLLTKLIDVSAGGVLLNKLQTMYSDSCVSIDPNDYMDYHIILFLDIDITLKLTARFVRMQENADGLYSYAFEFTNMKDLDIDTISKYVTKEQLEQIKLKRKDDEYIK